MIYLKKNSGYAVPKIFNFCFFEKKTGPAIKIHFLRKQSKFLMIRLAARTMSLFCYIFLIGKIMKL